MEEKKVRLLSLIISGVCLTLLWFFCPICFQNNDDKTLMYITAGFMTGTPEAGTVFGCFYYYGLIALLYKVYSGIAWYTIAELIMIGVSVWVICYCFIVSLDNSDSIVNKLIGIVIFVEVFLCCLLHFSVALQYTATAGLVAGASACSLILSLDSKKLFDYDFIISLFLLVASYGIRKQFGIVGFGGIICILFFELFSDKKINNIKKVLVVAIVFIIAFCCNAIYERQSGISEFNDYYAQAGKWNDYPHLKYEEDIEGVYSSVGWDETLYNAASNWFFMDENLTKDNFKTIVEAYDGDELTIRDIYDRAHSLILSSMIVNIQFVIWIFSIIVVNVLVILKAQRNNKYRLFTMDCLFLMCVVVSVYFLYEGRFPMRAYQALVFIFMMPSLVMGLSLLNSIEIRWCIPALSASIAVVAVCGFLIRPETNIIKYTYDVTHDKYRIMDIEKGKILEEYAINHSDSMFIYDLDLALPADPFQVYQDTVPNNLLFWGGWIYNTPMYWHQIQNNGLTSLYKEEFLGGNVYFCGMEVSDILTDYMCERYPEVQIDIVEQLGNIKIYQYYDKE